MKKLKYILLSTVLLGLCSCSAFDEMNRNPYEPDDTDLLPDNYGLGLFFQQMQNSAICTVQNDYQLCENLVGDTYGRYMTQTNEAWNSQSFATFNAPINWLNANFNAVFPNIYGPWFKIKEVTNSVGHQYAWAQILRVFAMQRLTDKYGPIPYSQVSGGSITVAYDSQEDVYKHMFEDLDAAIDVLKKFIESNPGSKPMAKYDLVYQGDYTKWVKFANSLKLRMAMRIVYADAELAKKKAEEAVNDDLGVFESVEDNANLVVKGNPIYVMWSPYKDTRVCADLTSYMNGYNDPRREKYFQKSDFAGFDYVGLRTGINIKNKDWALDYSAPNIWDTDLLLPWMNAAEIYFLRAEGALRGWNMSGAAADLYNEGIRNSFKQWGTAGVEDYIVNDVSVPEDYNDPNKQNSNARMSDITIKWLDNAPFERNLEQIITQKWIAMWPIGQEAWSEYRRTGYPKFMPVVVNNGGEAILKTELARRIPYAITEFDNNQENYLNAVQLLGGPDSYTTKLWWDKK